jgi:hypothetical protein
MFWSDFHFAASEQEPGKGATDSSRIVGYSVERDHGEHDAIVEDIALARRHAPCLLFSARPHQGAASHRRQG